MLMENHKKHKELPCVFMDWENTQDIAPREDLWCCLRKAKVTENYVKVLQVIFQGSKTMVRCILRFNVIA